MSGWIKTQKTVVQAGSKKSRPLGPPNLSEQLGKFGHDGGAWWDIDAPAPARPRSQRQSMAAATPEERKKAVRRWFGWWKYNRTSWKRKKVTVEPEEEDK